jgi:hypothetical protein
MQISMIERDCRIMLQNNLLPQSRFRCRRCSSKLFFHFHPSYFGKPPMDRSHPLADSLARGRIFPPADSHARRRLTPACLPVELAGSRWRNPALLAASRQRASCPWHRQPLAPAGWRAGVLPRSAAAAGARRLSRPLLEPVLRRCWSLLPPAQVTGRPFIGLDLLSSVHLIASFLQHLEIVWILFCV